MSTPSERIRKFREHVSVSQRDLAKILGVTPGALAMWENGDREMSGPALVLFEQLEQHFGLTENLSKDPALDSEHLTRMFTDKVLANLGPSSTLRSSNELASLRRGLREMIENYLSKLPGTRQVQVSLIDKILDGVANAKGLPLKLVQLASFIDYGLSYETRSMLVNIQNSLSPMTSKQLRQIFVEDFGAPPEEIFLEWTPRPLAAASIGQVHRAKLKDGSDVAVKVQYPNIHNKMVVQTEIFKLLSMLISLVRNDYADLLTDFVRKLREECDYKLEADNQQNYFDAFKDDPHIKIPKVHRDYSTARVLTSEFIDGQDFRTFAATAPQEDRNRVGGIIHRFNYEAGMMKGLIQADNHPMNFIITKDQVAFLDFGRTIHVSEEDLVKLRGFHRAIQSNDRAEARRQMEIGGYVRNWKDFDFDEFWEVMRTQMEYEISPHPTRFSKEYVRRIWRLANTFKQRSRLTMSSQYFWPVFASAGLWGLLAELEAEYPWRSNVLKGFPDLTN